MSELALRLIAKNKAAHERGEDATSLDLGNCGLTELPEELFECVWLEELVVSNSYWDDEAQKMIISDNRYLANKISKLSNNIINLIHLKKLRIEGDQDNTFNLVDIDSLSFFPELNELYLSYNKISDLTNFGCFLNKIKILDLSNNKIESISNISEIPSLESLFLTGNLLSKLDGINKFENLKILHIDSNRLYDLIGLERTTELKYLNASHNKIMHIEEVSHLHKLETLFLSFNRIQDLHVLNRLKNLQVLTLNSNGLNMLSGFLNLTQLRHLEINFNNLKEVSELQFLLKLESIDVSFNQLIDISGLLNLQYLQDVDLSSNSLKALGNLTNLKSLKKLLLESNQISSFKQFENLTSLQVLDLSNNIIRYVEFSKEFLNLQILHLRSNRIKFIKNIEKLSIIKSITLNNNKIKNIEFLNKIKTIESIDLRENIIQNLSLSLFENISLEFNCEFGEIFNFEKGKIFIKSNPIKNPPIEVIEQGKEFTIEYLRNRDKQPLNECKVIIVGRGGVGKTSLQKRLTHQPFNSKEPQTHGIRKVSWVDGVKAGDEKPITVNFWDFGGQDIQQTLHQFFYSKNTVYILVLNKRHDEDPEDFLELVRTYGHDSPVLVVYNNPKDLNQSSMLTYDSTPELDSSLRSKYPNIRRTFGLCCGQENDSGVNVLRKYLQDYIPTLDHVRETYPRSWLNIKHDLLNKVKKNYIPFDDYEELCSTHQVEKQEIQKGLAEMLNTVGTVTYFDRPFIGNRYYILNPDWLTTGTYQIIDSKQTTKKRGRINLDDLRIIFAEKLLFTYRPSDYEFLLQLMKEFALCHYEPSREEWLIPSSLKGESKTNLVAFKEEEYRQYCLKFPVSLPSSVIHRFIARNIQHAYDDDYWRNGIVVKHPISDTLMYVEADAREKEIRLWISGENIRDCWEFFRKDLRDFSEKFDYQELVTLPEGVRVSYQDLMVCKKKGKTEWFVPALGEDINVDKALGLFERQDPAEFMNMKRVSKKSSALSGSIFEILGLIDGNRIEEAFEVLNALNVSDQSLAQLGQEFELGQVDVNYISRLKMCIKRLSK